MIDIPWRLVLIAVPESIRVSPAYTGQKPEVIKAIDIEQESRKR